MSLRKPIAFVKASRAGGAVASPSAPAQPAVDHSRALYEQVLAQPKLPEPEPAAGPPATLVTRRRPGQRKDPPPPTGNQLLAAAEVDDTRTLARCTPAALAEARDPYGWSALMVAAAAGAGGAVEHILTATHRAADMRALLAIEDARGNTAVSLASAKGHGAVAAALLAAAAAAAVAADASKREAERTDQVGLGGASADLEHDRAALVQAVPREAEEADGGSDHTISPAGSDTDDAAAPDSPNTRRRPVVAATAASPAATTASTAERWCGECQAFYRTAPTLHLQTISHRQALFPRDRTKPFKLDASNKGYRMMVRAGWDTESGLGPTGEGARCPVKTVLKRDRRGIQAAPAAGGGGGRHKAMVTHFRANDVAAVTTAGDARAAAGQSTRQEIKRQAEHEARGEKRLRRMLADGPAHDVRETSQHVSW